MQRHETSADARTTAADPRFAAPECPTGEHARDRELIAGMIRGDKAALAELYDRHAGVMLGVAYRILCNRSDAEDLVHDVLLEAWNKATGYDVRRGTVRTWLLLRLRSRAIDRVRSLRVARKYTAEEEAGATPAANATDQGRSADHVRVHRAMDALDESQRVVVELSYFRGLTCREIAAQCEIPLGTAKSRLAAAIAKLRAQLAPEGSAAQ